MFESREEYQRGVKYYYGIWDKLCQRAETKWNREIVDRMWTISEKLWISINQKLQLTTVKLQDDQVEDLQLLFK